MASVLIDGFNLGMAKGTGIATYARNLSFELTNSGHDVSVLYGQSISDLDENLLREIAFFDPIDKPRKKLGKVIEAIGKALRTPLTVRPNELRLTGAVVKDSFAERLPKFSKIYNSHDLFNRSAIGFRIGRGMTRVEMPQSIDLAHWTYPLPIAVKGAANIYAMHDLVPLRLPYTTLDDKRHYLKLMRRIARQADHIVTVSETSKRDIMELLGVEESRITNTYQSVQLPEAATAFNDTEVANIIEDGLGIPFKGFYLFWGSIEPKKNIYRLIEGYLASGIEAPLVIVGAQAWKAEDQLRLIRDHEMEGKKRIIELSYAPQTMLIHLIRGARAALFPSLYEGFGLPALEAMTLGTPVITSNTASLPEVVGDAALTVDPYNSQDIAQALRVMDSDEDKRADFAKRGLERVKLFSPDMYRERLETLYGRLL
ncbi:MAG: glycosyltransferase family 1 protein [Pseudomonadota bacterium]